MTAFGPNEDRYKKASQPHENEEAALSAINRFLDRVSALREEFKVPEVLIVCSAYHGEGKAISSGAFFGNGSLAPEHGAAAFRAFTAPTIARARELESSAIGNEDAP